MTSWRSDIELVEPNDLREWMDGSAEMLADRTLTREHWQNYDSARRFVANPRMHDIHMRTWMSRSDCYEMARHQLKLARISMYVRSPSHRDAWDGIGPARLTPEDMLEAVERLVDADEWRDWARGKWPAFHDHPRERVELFGPVYDPEAQAEAQRAERKAREASAKAAKQRELELDIGDFEPKPAPREEPAAWRAEREARRERREALFAKWEAERVSGPVQSEAQRPLEVGDAVTLAGTAHGGWAASLPRRPWIVVACDCQMCARGTHVAIDVPMSSELLALYPDQSRWRHIAAKPLRRRGELSPRQAAGWADVLAMGGGVGQVFHWGHEDGKGDAARTALHEFAALALFDSLGGAPADEQARQLDRWRSQHGGDLL